MHADQHPNEVMLIENKTSASTRLRNRKIAFLTTVTLLVIFLPYASTNWDPYEVLGVRKDASLDQIKRAYRDLAKKYHPDKAHSVEDENGRRFIDINKAFNILKDPAKKDRYDRYKSTDESRYHQRASHHQNGYGNHGHHARQARESWSNGYRTFTFYSSIRDNYFRKKSISARQYVNEYTRESRQRPFIIFFYTDFCPSCSMIESTWIKITDELAKFNVGSATINVHAEHRLAHELGVSSIPHIACILDGQIQHYYQSDLTLTSFVKFIRNSLPSNLLPLLKTDYDQDRHITQTVGQHNKLSAILIINEETVKLRHLLLAYSLRQYYRFGYISTRLSEHKTISQKYNLSTGSLTHILVFDEHIESPKLHIQTESDKFALLDYTRRLLDWPFLMLPKLSSQKLFDDLCLYTIPKDGDKVSSKLCVILFTPATQAYSLAREKMMEFIALNGLERDKKVVFAYIDPEKQYDFVESLKQETKVTQPSFVGNSIVSSIILIERQSSHVRKAQYLWLSNQWLPNNLTEIESAKMDLYRYAMAYKQGFFELREKVLLNLLVDEDGPSLIGRIYMRLGNTVMRTVLFITSRESFSTVIMLIVCAMLTSLFLYKPTFPRQYQNLDENFQYYPTESTSTCYSNTKPTNVPPTAPQNVSDDHELNIMELKAETYNGMLRLLKPGYRSIILLTDQRSKQKLLTNFKKSVWPYRKNRTLLFGYLCLDKNLEWYKTLLESVLGCEGLVVNKKNCIGTVLSLNGFKKYFRVYHAKHHEIDYYDDETDNDGSFLGFEDREEAYNDDLEHGGKVINKRSRNDVVYTVDNLLDKLPIWLDKMFDGLTKRYFLDEWPDEIK